jgi:putative spermidine/putrescine transport system ATP-binding protein
MQNFGELRLDRISRHFHTHAALRELDLTIKAGEFISLLGPSGCGKSTALNCMAGLLSLTSGEIRLDGKRIDTLPPEQRGFGMVFQNYALFPHMSVRKNIAFGLEMRGIKRSEVTARVDKALKLVRLEALGDRLPGQLSGGQQQRVAIARAAVIEPPLVLMDEPLSNLDAKLRIEMRHEIRRLHNELGLTTIYVTHDQDEALSLSDRIVVMRDGVKRQEGTPEELYQRPKTLDVALFMGFRNVLDVEARQDGAGRMTADSGAIRLGALGQAPAGPAIAAFRPDDVMLAGEDGQPAHVGTVEYCGRDWLADLTLPDGRSVLMRSAQALTKGEPIRFTVPPDRVRVFSGEDALA